MSLFIKIIDVHAREILDSRGNPTVEVEVTAETETTGKKITARESVPSIIRGILEQMQFLGFPWRVPKPRQKH